MCRVAPQKIFAERFDGPLARYARRANGATEPLTTFALLARRGHAPQLVIGAVPEGGFEAHAWVTVDGVPVVAPAREYVPLWNSGPAPGEAS